MGMPVIVRNLCKGYDWRPQTMMRATRERGTVRTDAPDVELEVCTGYQLVYVFLG